MAKDAFDKNWEKPVFKGVLLKRTSNQAISPSGTTMTWQASTYDTNGFWSSSTNPTRITVLPGIRQCRLNAGLRLASGATIVDWFFFKNGTSSFDGLANNRVPMPASGSYIAQVTSPVLNVETNDYFEVRVSHNAVGTRNAMSGSSLWFALEAVS